MAFNVQEMSFSYTNFQKNEEDEEKNEEYALLPRSLPRFGPHLQILAAPLLLE